uniref:SLAM family member 7 n=1 Tax=Pipistrellus kuhlii TaxID=59472 RepID=A0A7J7UUL5_PIPKU|nr:SLAM family member 7 [Pipistrellus kuhlii]
MPVSPANLILILLLCQLMGPAASGAQEELVGGIGGFVIFPLTHSQDRIDSIIWFFERTTLVTIQPATTNKSDTVIVTNRHNQERVAFSRGNYSLKLSKLSKNDSGAYVVEIHSSSLQKPITQKYGLRVYEKSNKEKRTDTHLEILNCYPPSGETSEYYTISNPNTTIPEENSINSLYSTVQMPPKVEKPHSLPTSPDKSTLFTYEKVI